MIKRLAFIYDCKRKIWFSDIWHNSVRATFDYDMMFHMVKYGDNQSIFCNRHATTTSLSICSRWSHQMQTPASRLPWIYPVVDRQRNVSDRCESKCAIDKLGSFYVLSSGSVGYWTVCNIWLSVNKPMNKNRSFDYIYSWKCKFPLPRSQRSTTVIL